jgi:hypothetical protein
MVRPLNLSLRAVEAVHPVVVQDAAGRRRKVAVLQLKAVAEQVAALDVALLLKDVVLPPKAEVVLPVAADAELLRRQLPRSLPMASI